MNSSTILEQLQAQANPVNVAGMARFDIRPAHPLGISVNTVRGLARVHVVSLTPQPPSPNLGKGA